ncbi:hypothetical protein HPP92_012204 [Vanilla planifolia]|uniref:Alpha-1,4 glucan phosphorylase n=1 Tax=Vanilla planifolia TaxID=51239 RepID=A0A835V559_VANPL|nr:hypothetical protein HPP92_012204 [Vanilla planifolia]
MTALGPPETKVCLNDRRGHPNIKTDIKKHLSYGTAICAVLYPGDTMKMENFLRLKQQFFLCSASLQDIIARFKGEERWKRTYQWTEFPNKVSVQLNDTHPTLAIPELMRLLMDDEGLGWDQAWDVTSRTVSYTNHTVLPEALEKWSQAIIWKLLPVIWKSLKKLIRGIITKWLKSDAWITNLDLLSGLRQFADNVELHAEWSSAKMASKRRLAQYIFHKTGVSVDQNSLFDIQIKRIHEYKRQLLNILGAIYRYKKLKRVVKLVNDVGSVVNNDSDINDYLKIVFVPNYNVSVAEILIPRSELSQHISTAGMEASGTSNMKFALNGCLIIGTLDGANVEIREEIGEDNFFLFGAKADNVPRLRKERENGLFKPDARFEEAKHFIRSGAFGSYDYGPLLDSLEGNCGYGRGDYFLVGHDFPSYMDAQDQVDEAYKDQKRWLKMSILSTAGCGKFSSDRTIAQYAKEIWGINPCPVP